MKNKIQDYAWGSPDAIPGLLGYDNPRKKPQAELWMGTHPRGPSQLLDGDREFPLSDLSGNLPFLFKVLAAGSPLSIQVHPDKKQAEEGFARENGQFIDLNAFNRNYKDDNHKPEIMCAITDFWALRGFRKIDDILKNFNAMDIAAFSDEVKTFGENRTPEGLKRFFTSLMSLGGGKRTLFIQQLVSAAKERTDDIARWVMKLHDKYPDDPSASAPLYLNLVKLRPGQALYLAAGELHAYLEGLGMELMANSDNVLRGGLTPKYIDRDELQRILNFTGADPQIIEPEDEEKGVKIYRTPSKEFELSRISLSLEDRFDASLPDNQIFFVLEGAVLLRSSDGEIIEAKKGESLFLPADCTGWEAGGPSVLYRASLPRGGKQ